ncbi:MAG: hypothetical protein P4L22_02425 [Candidatus Babeliales bacterium]|nr:hypothetical protein [Candidatus Babeliales bacterium]
MKLHYSLSVFIFILHLNISCMQQVPKRVLTQAINKARFCNRQGNAFRPFAKSSSSTLTQSMPNYYPTRNLYSQHPIFSETSASENIGSKKFQDIQELKLAVLKFQDFLSDENKFNEFREFLLTDDGQEFLNTSFSDFILLLQKSSNIEMTKAQQKLFMKEVISSIKDENKFNELRESLLNRFSKDSSKILLRSKKDYIGMFLCTALCLALLPPSYCIGKGLIVMGDQMLYEIVQILEHRN